MKKFEDLEMNTDAGTIELHFLASAFCELFFTHYVNTDGFLIILKNQ